MQGTVPSGHLHQRKPGEPSGDPQHQRVATGTLKSCWRGKYSKKSPVNTEVGRLVSDNPKSALNLYPPTKQNSPNTFDIAFINPRRRQNIDGDIAWQLIERHLPVTPSEWNAVFESRTV